MGMLFNHWKEDEPKYEYDGSIICIHWHDEKDDDDDW